MNILPMLLADFYKLSHKRLYDTENAVIYSTWTPRKSRLKGVDKVVFFGLQGFIKKYLIDYFNENFFKQDIDVIVTEYKRILSNTIGGEIETEHIRALWNLGYLPIKIQALPEGTLTPIRVPMFTIENTKPEFYWITNFLETLMSAEIWKPMTSATLALQYRKIVEKWAEKTCPEFNVEYQAHDFSFRGLTSVECACTSGAGHLTIFKGTDTVPAICYLEKYYNADVEKEVVGTSIPATEHSIMEFNSYGSETDEYNAFKRMITEVHPSGFVSIVSDTWNLWEVLTKTVPSLKQEILNRDGKVVIRPDSGDPCDIICGLNTKGSHEDFMDKALNHMDATNMKEALADVPYIEQQMKGVVELLWDTFGGTINEKGYKVLDSHIGCIYGDAITMERCDEICRRLESKGFAAENVVFGIGSYTYNMNTRDTFGFALKTTYAKQGETEMQLYKDPITDDGTKKSQKGKVAVIPVEEVDTGKLVLTYVDGLNEDAKQSFKKDDLLQTVYEDGKLVQEYTLQQVRDLLQSQIKEKEVVTA